MTGIGWQVQRMVIGRTDCVALLVRELQLDVIVLPALLVAMACSSGGRSAASIRE